MPTLFNKSKAKKYPNRKTQTLFSASSEQGAGVSASKWQFLQIDKKLSLVTFFFVLLKIILNTYLNVIF